MTSGAGAVGGRPQAPLDLAIALLNTWDLLERPPELLRSVDSLRRFLRWAGQPADDVLTDDDLATAIAGRGRLRAALEAGSEEEAAAVLNGVVLEVGGVAQLVGRAGEWRLDYAVRDGGPIAALLARAAGGMLDAIREGLYDRLGVCAADPCRCAYVDRTKNRARRYCSTLCTDRMMQAAYRRRKRVGG